LPAFSSSDREVGRLLGLDPVHGSRTTIPSDTAGRVIPEAAAATQRVRQIRNVARSFKISAPRWPAQVVRHRRMGTRDTCIEPSPACLTTMLKVPNSATFWG